MRPELSVKHKILLSLWVSTLLLLVLVGTITSVWFRQDQANRLDDFLSREVQTVQETLGTFFAVNAGEGPVYDSVVTPAFQSFLTQYLQERMNRPLPYKTTLGIFGPQGNLVQASNFALNLTVGGVRPPSTFQVTTVAGAPAYRMAEVALLHNEITLGSIRLACLTSTLAEGWMSFFSSLVMILGLAFVSFGFLGTWLINWSLGPIRVMSKSAREISESHLDRRLTAPPGNDELAQMALTINQLLTRLEQDFLFQETLVGQLSHELRTPLAILRGRNEVALERSTLSQADIQRILEDNIGDIDSVGSLLNTLLRLARLDGRMDPVTMERCDMALLLPDLIDELQPLWEEKDLSLKLNLPGGITMWSRPPILATVGDPVLLRQIFLNILTNAFKYAPKGSQIRINIQESTDRDLPVWSLDFQNSGPPIPTESLELIFRRFYRVEVQDPDHYETSSGIHQKGFGLGLSIAKTLVDLHKGTIRAHNPVVGGAGFEVRLPRVISSPTSTRKGA